MAGGCAWQGGMHGGGACVAGGVHSRRGHAWQEGGMHGWGGVRGRYYEIRSMSGRYASYWNAFLFASWIKKNI